MAEISHSQLSANSQLPTILRTSAKRTREVFASDFASPSTLDSLPTLPYSPSILPDTEPPSKLADEANIAARIHFEYSSAKDLPPALAAKQQSATASTAAARRAAAKKAKAQDAAGASDSKTRALIEDIEERSEERDRHKQSQALVLAKSRSSDGKALPPNAHGPTIQDTRGLGSNALVRREALRQPRPDWHAPWKLLRVAAGHLGWVRALACEPNNEWFASGAGDRTIKIWNLATGALRLTLTGHTSTVRGLAVSSRHPYLFSCGEDKKILCWDLETNKIIRNYHGTLSAAYTLALHPTLDLLVSGGRDAAVRVWDLRSRANVHVLTGHQGTISDVKCQDSDPQVISASLDGKVRLWDLAAGKTQTVLTHHKKGVRSLALHPREFTFASASAGSIKQFKFPEGSLMANFDGHNSIINTLSVSEDNVLFSGGDDGSVCFWDWKSGHCFQKTASVAQPGSLEAENGIFASTYDLSGLRLITGHADKTIRVWGRDEGATEETHPLDWKPTLGGTRRF